MTDFSGDTPTPFLFGTAGWSYSDWEGTVYPEKKGRDFNHLQFLSRHFQFVEVNTTFYRIPAVSLVNGWVRKTMSIPHFKFWIKLFQNFTHFRNPDPSEIRQFRMALQPLHQDNRLSGYLAQFPYSFKKSPQHLTYVLQLHRHFKDVPFAVEFRHNSWDDEEVLSRFTENQIIWVNIDQPQVSLSLPLTAHLTHTDTSYFRLHGRNSRNWFADKGRNARYDWDYNSRELNQIADILKTIQTVVRHIYISGNNHYRGNAVKNLLDLERILNRGERI